MTDLFLELEETTTGQVEAMNLTHKGFAGEFQERAIEILFRGEDYSWTEESWADIMTNEDGQEFAVKADGSLTECSSFALIAEL